MILLLAACQDYELETKEPQPPGGHDTAARDDVTDDAYDCSDTLELATAGPWAGERTCAALGEVDWTLAIERDDTHGAGSTVSWPIALPLDGAGNVAVLYQCDDRDVVAWEPSTGSEVAYWEDLQSDFNGLGAATDSGGTTWIGVATLADFTGAMSELVVVSTDGAEAWSGPVPTFVAAAVADLDHDGDPELFTDGYVFDRDATPLLTYDTANNGLFPTVADADGDGDVDVLGSYGVVDLATGDVAAWDFAPGVPTGRILTAGVARDAEGALTIVGSAGHSLFRADATGEVVWSFSPGETPLGTGVIGVPALGDVDGDRVPEIAVAVQDEVHLFGLDGVARWAVAAGRVTSGGIAMADLDADGRYEVIEWGDEGLFVRSGATGEVLGSRTDIRSSFWFNHPIVADVDGDGGMEIVVSGAHEEDEMWQDRLFVVGPASGRWARGRPVWNQLLLALSATGCVTNCPDCVKEADFDARVEAAVADALAAEGCLTQDDADGLYVSQGEADGFQPAGDYATRDEVTDAITTLSGDVVHVLTGENTWTVTDGDDLLEKLAALDGYHIASDATLWIVLMAGGTYSFDEMLEIHHPDGGRVRIEGETGDPADVVLSFPDGTNGILIGGSELRYLGGVSIVGGGTDVTNHALIVTRGSVVGLGPLHVSEFGGTGLTVAGGSYVYRDPEDPATAEAGWLTLQGGGYNSLLRIEQGSVATLSGVTVSDSLGYGVEVRESSYLDASYATVSSSGTYGVYVDAASGASFSEATSSGNASAGFVASGASYLEASGATATLNGDGGFLAMLGSTMALADATASGNESWGVAATMLSSVSGSDGDGDGAGMTISDNRGGGVVLGRMSFGALGSAVISGNLDVDSDGDGVQASKNSFFEVDGADITGNANCGVRVLYGGSGYLGTASITDNGGDCEQELYEVASGVGAYLY